MTSLHARERDADRISIIGLGPMGIALADASLARGQALTVWNRTPEKADDLVARGALRAPTVAEAVAALPKGGDAGMAEAELLKQAEAIAATPVSEAEVAAAKQRIGNAIEKRASDVNAMAMALSASSEGERLGA